MKRVMWQKTPDAQENLTVRLSLAGKTAQEAAKIAHQVYVTSPDDWATSSMKKAQASLETMKMVNQCSSFQFLN